MRGRRNVLAAMARRDTKLPHESVHAGADVVEHITVLFMRKGRGGFVDVEGVGFGAQPHDAAGLPRL